MNLNKTTDLILYMEVWLASIKYSGNLSKKNQVINLYISSTIQKTWKEGFPGNLVVGVEYILNDSNELKIKYTASTDKKNNY